MQVVLFDKYVNLNFYLSSGTVLQTIATPAVGPKPSIRISGKWTTSSDVQGIEIRVTNLLVDRPLSDYGTGRLPGYVSVEAGYRGGLSTAIKGKVVNSYQETPGPDGVTVFEVLLGQYEEWTRNTIQRNYAAGTLMKTVLADLCSALNLNLLYAADPTLNLPHSFSFTGLAKDALYRLQQMFVHYTSDGLFDGLRLIPLSHDLIACSARYGTGVVHQLDYVSHAKHNAAGFDIMAPWDPSIRPYDKIRVDPKYFRQDFGGSLVQAGNLFLVLFVQFEFASDDDTNMMTLMAVGSQEAAD